MEKIFKLPKNERELEQLEIQGFWRAMATANKIADSNEKITLESILSIHKTMFQFAAPEHAGRFRKNGEDIKKLKCIEPPPGRLVQSKMYEFWREMDNKLAIIPSHLKSFTKNQRKKWFRQVFEVAAWTQHSIAQIHPFCNGNGRMARLMTNVILRKFNLPPSRVKYEGENKSQYINALCQIDNYRDYEPLIHLIACSVGEAFKKEEQLRRKRQESY